MSVLTSARVDRLSQSRALTVNQVNAISKGGVHWVAPSLYMQIRDHGTRSCLFRCSRGGTNQWMGLGSTDEKPVSEARDEAAMLRVLVKRGEDPIANKRQVEAKRKIEMKPNVPAFADCATQYIASHKSGWKNEKHSQQWPSTLRCM